VVFQVRRTAGTLPGRPALDLVAADFRPEAAGNPEVAASWVSFGTIVL
jgi:hypothetical protein